ncbi:uncharacterized protein Z519_10821 [Cladophialophora bantiana CBS 173.52]|uniref:Ig-like domain-containing protein n=1 Tax=Cladophialophora bantiana (strain ATCC 10958 / CBS 173.52 / CDC B-1940 / NIH 8579) TaxID=1442370 RepID=A0A0D2HW11_CLAB1|nr:uncharacterized protein Z519_10821 [Cladophialophora bantiana CBS 173.52]KIW88774.1 hypothetical protein Z519_10821 [Cladophialophora bantiana CBS 173.52]
METLLLLIALAAPIISTKQHEGRAHLHFKERRRQTNSPVDGLGTLATPAPAAAVTTTPSITTTISSYVFPTTVIQEPVATVCPDAPASSAIFSILPISSLAPTVGSKTTQGSITNSSMYFPIRVNATALLPNGSTTVFLSTSTTSVLPTTSLAIPAIESSGAETARIVLDKNGCQTVYSTKTTTWCSTTVQPAGMLPVSITDCDQYVTFSSQKLYGCSTTSGACSLSLSAPLDTNESVVFYAAHWYDLIQGPIPNIVEVQDCASIGWNCITSSESWDVVTTTIASIGTSVASFAGPAVVTSGTYTVTTTLSFKSTVTTTTLITSSAISRHRLRGGTIAITSEQTVTVLVTVPTTRTFSLDSLTRTTITIRQTSTVEVTETRTRPLSSGLPNATGLAV